MGSRRQAEKAEGLRGGKEGLWGWGWFSMEQRRHRGTSQHAPVPMGKASRGWGQALPGTAWWEGERPWHLLKLERFRLEIRKKKQNPCEDHKALEGVAQRGGGIPEPAGLQDLRGHNPEHNCHKPVKGCSLKSWKRKHCQGEIEQRFPDVQQLPEGFDFLVSFSSAVCWVCMAGVCVAGEGLQGWPLCKAARSFPGSKSDPPLGKAEPISDGGSASVSTY